MALFVNILIFLKELGKFNVIPQLLLLHLTDVLDVGLERFQIVNY